MNIRKFVFVMVLALAAATAVATAGTQGALAQCGPDGGCPEPDEREQRPTVTDVPSPTPTETPTPVPPAACLPPDADQLAELCAGLIPPPSGNAEPPMPPPADPPLPKQDTGLNDLKDAGAAAPGPPNTWLLVLGGGGLFLGGAAIGRMLPAVQRGIGGSGGRASTSMQPGPTGDASQKVMPAGSEHMFAKFQDQAVQKVAPGDWAGQKVTPSLGDETSQKVAPGDQASQKVSPAFQDETSQKVFPQDAFGDAPGGPGEAQMTAPGPPNAPNADAVGGSPGGPGEAQMTNPGPPNAPNADEFSCAKLGDNAAQKVLPDDSFGAPTETGGSTGMSNPGPPDLPEADESSSVK